MSGSEGEGPASASLFEVFSEAPCLDLRHEGQVEAAAVEEAASLLKSGDEAFGVLLTESRFETEAAETAAAAERVEAALRSLRQERADFASTLSEALKTSPVAGGILTAATPSGDPKNERIDWPDSKVEENGAFFAGPLKTSLVETTRAQLEALEERTAETGRRASALKELLEVRHSAEHSSQRGG